MRNLKGPTRVGESTKCRGGRYSGTNRERMLGAREPGLSYWVRGKVRSLEHNWEGWIMKTLITHDMKRGNEWKGQNIGGGPGLLMEGDNQPTVRARSRENRVGTAKASAQTSFD